MREGEGKGKRGKGAFLSVFFPRKTSSEATLASSWLDVCGRWTGFVFTETSKSTRGVMWLEECGGAGRVGRDGREQVPTLAAQHERDNWARPVHTRGITMICMARPSTTILDYYCGAWVPWRA